MGLSEGELAKSLGLPRRTIRRVLEGEAGDYGIPPEVVTRVMNAVRAKGFGPNDHVRATPRNSHPLIGLIVTHLSNPFFGNVASAADGAARAAGFHAILGASNEELPHERELVDEFIALGAEGLIIAAAGPEFDHLWALQEEDFPFVLVDRHFEDLDCDWVAVENVQTSRALCDRLIEHGARRIAYLGPRPEASTGRGRLEGYRAALRRRRIPFDNSLVHLGDFTAATGLQGAEKLLRLSQPPDALFCANNQVFMACNDRLASAPKVPWAHLPCAVFDEVPYMAHLGRPLVVASQPEEDLGRRATELLLARVRSAGPVAKPCAHELLEVRLKTFGF